MKNIGIKLIVPLLLAGSLFTNCSKNSIPNKSKKGIITCNENFFCTYNEEEKAYEMWVPIDTSGDLKSDKDLVFLSPSEELDKINQFYRDNNNPNYILINYKMKDKRKIIKNLKVYDPLNEK